MNLIIFKDANNQFIDKKKGFFFIKNSGGEDIFVRLRTISNISTTNEIQIYAYFKFFICLTVD